MEFIGKIWDDYLLKNTNEIVIYGCGMLGKQVFSYLEEKQMINKVVAFCDKNASVHNGFFNGKKTGDIDYCASEYPNAVYLIACADILNVIQTLESHQIKRIHITV